MLVDLNEVVTPKGALFIAVPVVVVHRRVREDNTHLWFKLQSRRSVLSTPELSKDAGQYIR